MPPAIKPSAPSPARTPPVGSSISATRRTKPSRARMTKASMPRLSAFAVLAAERVGAEVLFEGLLVGVLAPFQVTEVAPAVVVGGVGEAARDVDALGDVLVGVREAGIGDRDLFEE